MPDSTQFKIKTCACSSVAPQSNGTGSTREAHVSWDVSPTVTHGLAVQSAANFCRIKFTFFLEFHETFDALSYVSIPAPLCAALKKFLVFSPFCEQGYVFTLCSLHPCAHIPPY
ncbi:hypothetical protein C8R43DRAFT_1137196 [Mycena crocata]|nr:hypothetical protein C8R43DRAFT_1137196 [Mycena crocata]